MGRAARAKESRGNPTPFIQMSRVISASKFNEHSTILGRLRRIVFSDREYVMDQFGTLRRSRPTAQTLSTRRPD